MAFLHTDTIRFRQWASVTLLLCLLSIAPASVGQTTNTNTAKPQSTYTVDNALHAKIQKQRAAREAGRWAEAETLTRQMMPELAKTNIPPEVFQYELVYLTLKQEKYSQAKTELEKYLTLLEAKKNKTSEDTTTIFHNLRLLGDVQTRLKEWDPATVTFRKAYELSVSNAEMDPTPVLQDLYNLSVGLYKDSKIAEAITLLQGMQSIFDSATRQPSDEMLQVAWKTTIFQASLLVEQNHYPEAAKILERAVIMIRQYPVLNADAQYWPSNIKAYGDMAFNKGDYPHANLFYNEALRLQKEKPFLDTKELWQVQSHLTETVRTDMKESYLGLQGKNIYHWNEKNGHVYIYITDGSQNPVWKPQMVTMIHDAFDEWQKLLGDRLTFDFVDRAKDADVQVLWLDHEKRQKKEDEYIKLGVNNTELWDKYIAKSNIEIYMDNIAKIYSDDKFYNVILHEIGHLLGIATHSNNPGDVMFSRVLNDMPERIHLSERDKNTLLGLYEMAPTFTNPDKIRLASFEKFKNKRMQEQNCDNVPMIMITGDGDTLGQLQAYQQKTVCHPIRPVDRIPVWIPRM